MNLASKLKKGGGQLAIGQLLTQLSSLARNIILARLLAPEDFGLATTFVLALAMLEMISSMSAELLLVQSKNATREGYLDAVHGFVFLRGMCAAVLVYFCAGAVARIFKTPELEWAYQLLSIVPLIKAFTHLEYKKVQRYYNYKKEMWVESIPQVSSLVLVFPLFLLDKSPVLGLWVVVVQATVSTAVSHFTAASVYRMSFDTSFLKEVFTFGAPLMLSGLLMFFAIQGDRFLVGHYYSAYEFGVFSAIALLVMNLANALAKFSTALMLPPLSGCEDDKFFRLLNSFSIIFIASSLFITLLVFAFGDQFIGQVYGVEYVFPGLSSAFSLFFISRVMRFPITVAAISKGNTSIPLVSNIIRLSGVALAFLLSLQGVNLIYIVIAGCLGEYLALLTGNYLFYMRYRASSRAAIYPVIVVGVIGLFGFAYL